MSYHNLVILGLLLAQAPIDSYQVRYYAAGASAPQQVYTIPANAVVCNQAPSSSTLTANPTRIEWDDPQASGRVCRYDEVPGGPLFALPVGNYEGTLVALNANGASPESNRAPFVVGVVAGAPTHFKIIR
jgi:hypothetical protein